MATDFLKMLKEQQEASKKEIIKETEQPKKVEKVSQTKEMTSKTNKKAIAFEEQFKNATPQAKAIVRYLIFKYPDIKEKMKHPDVSINGMERYIESQVRANAKHGMFVTVPQELIDAFPEEAKKEGYISDNAVYGWGRHYYDEHGKVA